MLGYSIREGLAGFRRAKVAALASTSAMTVALILIGLFGLVALKTDQVSDYLRQRVGEVEIFLDDVDEPVARAIRLRAETMPGVANTDFVSSEEAQQIFMEEFGEGAEDFFDQAFLPASIRVQARPSYANPDSLAGLVAEFEQWNHVDEVVFNQPLLVKVQENIRLLTIAGLTLGALVVLAAIFLVANTIRLTIYARRLLIRTMKLVGATDVFIRRPFVVEGVGQGLVAGLLAGGIIWGAYVLLAGYLPQVALGQWDLIGLLGGVFVMGVLLGWFGSFVAARRFIKKVALH